MVVSAYILITTKSGTEKEVLDGLKKLPETKDIGVVYGEYDIVVKVKIDDIAALNDFLLEKVRPIKNIEKTSTLIVAA